MSNQHLKQEETELKKSRYSNHKSNFISNGILYKLAPNIYGVCIETVE